MVIIMANGNNENVWFSVSVWYIYKLCRCIMHVVFILLLQLNYIHYCQNYVSEGAKLTNECEVHKHP